MPRASYNWDEDLEEELPRNEPKGDRDENAKHRRNHRVCIPGRRERLQWLLD
jgi:hypothetical protein